MVSIFIASDACYGHHFTKPGLSVGSILKKDKEMTRIKFFIDLYHCFAFFSIIALVY